MNTNLLKFSSFLFLMAFGQILNAQSESGAYIISDIKDTIILKDKGYYVLKVNDLRINKSNLGSIKFKSVKQTIQTPDSLHTYLQKAFSTGSAADSSLRPLIINIEKLKSFASSNGNIDEAELYVKLYVQAVSASDIWTIHQFERTFTYRKKSRPDFISECIRTSLTIALSNLKVFKTTIKKDVSERNFETSVTESSDNYKKPEKSIPVESNKPIYIISFPEKLVLTPQVQLTDIKDERLNKDNVGNVFIGYFNRNAVANLDSGMSSYLGKILKSDTLPGSRKVKLIIKKLDCSERITNLGEEARFSLIVQLEHDTLNAKYIYNGKVSIDTISDADVTTLWPDLISKGFQKLFKEYSEHEALITTLDTAKNIDVNEIVTVTRMTRNYYINDSEIKKIGDFKNIFSKTKDDSLKLMYKRSKILVRSGRVLIAAGIGMFLYPVGDYLNNEEKSLKKWYNDSNPTAVKTLLIEKKTLVPFSIAVIGTGLVIKWLGKNLLTQSISRYNKSLIERISLDINPNLNGSGYSFRLGVMLCQGK